MKEINQPYKLYINKPTITEARDKLSADLESSEF
jgi:hypothetical protein